MIVPRSAAQLRNRVGLARIGRTGDADNRARRHYVNLVVAVGPANDAPPRQQTLGLL